MGILLKGNTSLLLLYQRAGQEGGEKREPEMERVLRRTRHHFIFDMQDADVK